MSTDLVSFRVLLPFVLAASLLGGCGGPAYREAAHLRRGQGYLEKGDLEKARIEFRNALQIAPTDAKARFQNGVVDEKLGNVREAAQFYQGAIDVNPDDVPARVALGRLYLFAGLPQLTMKTIGPGIAKHPDDPGLLTDRAAARVQLKDPAGALSDAERAVKLAPDDENAVAVLAGIYRSSGRAAQAQSLLEGAVKKLPDTISLRLALAQLYGQTGQAARIEPLLKDLVRLQPTVEANRLQLARYYAVTKQLDAAEQVLRQGVTDLPDNRDMKLQLVTFLAAERSPQAADKQIQAFIAGAPDDEQLKLMQAGYYQQSGQIVQAEAVYNGIIADQELKPAGLTARDRLAALLLQQNDIQGAKKLIAAVLAAQPRDDDALVLRGDIALVEKDPKTAIEDLRAVLRDRPNSVGVMRALARAHIANGEPALAEDVLRSAVEANPTDPDARLDLARLLGQLGHPNEAQPFIEELLKQQPNNVQALDAQFNLALALKDYGTAKSAADAIVALQPKQWVGYQYQGLLAEIEKRYDAAVALDTKALDMDPQAAAPLQGLTRVLIAMNRRDEALARLDAVIKAYPNLPIAASLKGEVLLDAHRPADAVGPFKLAIARAPKWDRPYDELALTDILIGDRNAAIAALRSGIASVDQPIMLETKLAQLYLKLGREGDAEQVYEAALTRNPRDAVAANNLAMLLVRNHPQAQALDHAAALTASFADSTNPDFLDTYGWVQYKRGHADQAIVALETASSKRPDSPVSLYHLGMAQILAGQTAAARESLEKALAPGRPFDGADEAKAALGKLAKLAPKINQG